MNEQDAHRQLLQLVYEYIKLNLKLESKVTFTASVEARHILSEIRRVARVRRAEIQSMVKDKRKQKSRLQGEDDEHD